MKIKYIYLLIAIFCNCTILQLLGQTNNLPFISQLTPPSPDAAALSKYGQYPVSMCNGLVQIEIPIHTIALPLLKLPVSISYHASGIKVDEISTVVGLGWSLNAGGVISRSIRGIPDENFGSPGSIYSKQWVINNLSVENRIDYLSQRQDLESINAFDSESDVYYYNVCGMSGSFRLDINGNLVQIPLTNNIIEFDSGTNTFQITGSDGTIYGFGDKERSGHLTGSGSVLSYTSSWYLSWIKTIDGREIDFNYTVDNTIYREYNLNYWMTTPQEKPGYSELMCSSPYSTTNNTLLLHSITYPGGAVRFTYNDDRADRRKYRLTRIDIKTGNNQTVKAFALEQGYFTPWSVISVGQAQNGNYSSNCNYRLKLNQIMLLDSQGSQTASYSFDYNTSALLPAYLNLSNGSIHPDETGNNMFYFGQDHWGYYNGITTNKNLFTYENNQSYVLDKSQANRSVSPYHAQACILKKITYPTGGYTEFEYEGHQDITGAIRGGLRIQNVKSYASANANPEIHSYQYENGVHNIIGWKKILTGSYSKVEIPKGDIEDPEVKFFDYYLFQPNFPLSHSGGASVFYPKVIEYEGYPNDSNGKTEYAFLYSFGDVDYIDLFPCTMPSTPWNSFIPLFDYLFIDRGWCRGYPTRISVYKKLNGVFSLIKRTINEYTIFKQHTANVGFKSFCNFNIIRRPMPYPFEDPNMLFQYTDITAETGLIKLTQVKDSSFYDGGFVSKLTTHFYDRLDNQYEVTATYERNSDGSVLKKSFTYPKDINTGIYSTMNNLNMLSPIITTTDSLDNKFLQETQTLYSAWHNSFIAPSSIRVRRTVGQQETDITYHSYDTKGNLLYVSRRDADKTVFLWSYNYQYPIAKIENATYAEVETAAKNVFSVSGMDVLSAQTTPNETILQNGNLQDALPNAQVTTYTYKPLTGIKTATDPRKVKITYEYDAFGRLQTVKDHTGNTIEKYDYHYKNP